MKTKAETMKTKIAVLAAVLTAGSVWAQTATVTATDGTINATYGVCNGFLIDFNSTVTTYAPWAPSLVGGQQGRRIPSPSNWELRIPQLRILEVYAGNVGGGAGTGQAFSLNTLTFLGASQNAINFSTVTLDTWQTYNFSGINVTADSVTPGALGNFTGSGTLFFVYQPVTTAVSSWVTDAHPPF